MSLTIAGRSRFAPGSFPAELRTRQQWVGFKIVPNGDGKPKKIPVIATAPTRNAKTNDPSTWGTLAEAIAGIDTGAFDAVGYALNGDFIGVDLDGDRWVDGKGGLTEEAAEVVNRCGTYAELSISRRGVHVLLRGKLARGRADHSIGVEMYSDGRFLIFTGRRLSHSPVAINENRAAVDWLLARFFPDDTPTEKRETTEKMTSVFSVTSVFSEHSALSVDDVIKRTLPQKRGQRNDCVLKLARGLKFDAGLADRSPASLKPFVREWHRQALPFISTQPFDDSWADFVRALDAAKYPLQWKADEWALAKARSEPPPSIAAEYDTESVRLLVGICWHLASLAKDRHFFLSCHQVGALFGVSHEKAMRWLKMLIADGALALLEPGHQRRANRYRWIAPQLPREKS